jgi:transposase
LSQFVSNIIAIFQFRFEYYRHGTLSLYAALNTAPGRVHGKTAARHTSREFVAFLQEVVALCPPGQQIHIILDNLSAHKTQAVREFLHQHPRVRFHFTPTYSSWLNQVEIWFAKIEREVIARGIFTSVSDLARKLRRYINAYSANARPIQWKYSDTTRRVRSNEFTATGHSQLRMEEEAARIQPLHHSHHRTAKQPKVELPSPAEAAAKEGKTAAAARKKPRAARKTATKARKMA